MFTVDVAVGGFLLAVASFFIGQRSAAKSDGERQGELFAELKNIKEDVRELKDDVKLLNIDTLRSELDNLKTYCYSRFDRHSESIRRGHQRIDNHLRQEHMIKVEEIDYGEED